MLFDSICIIICIIIGVGIYETCHRANGTCKKSAIVLSEDGARSFLSPAWYTQGRQLTQIVDLL
jgi:hypothetical protein